MEEDRALEVVGLNASGDIGWAGALIVFMLGGIASSVFDSV